MAFSVPVDIANRAAVHLGVPLLTTLGDNSKAANVFSTEFDKLRQVLLREHVWRYSCRRAGLRPITSTMRLITFPTYAAGTTYQQGDIVNDTTANAGNSGTALYISLVASNTGNTPSSSPASWTPYFGVDCADTWSSTNTYSTGEIVYYASGAGSKIYLSTANGNVNNTPTGGSPWTAAALTGATTAIIFIPYPITQINSGATRTAYRLPFGYMRVAPQDPKAAGVSYQTVSAGMQFSDYQFEGNYLLTAAATISGVTSGPLLFRYVADISDVAQMDPAFCELFGARLGFETCEYLTQNKQLKQDLAARYDNILNTAWKDNMLEQGSTDPSEMGFLTSRVPNMGTQEPRGR